jgi:hypothetical protein
MLIAPIDIHNQCKDWNQSGNERPKVDHGQKYFVAKIRYFFDVTKINVKYLS